MNFENLNNIIAPIEAENNQEQEDKLNEKIEQISLIYAGKKWQEEKENNSGYKFSEAVKTYTPTENIILKPVFRLNGFSKREYQDKIESFKNEFYQELDEIASNEKFDVQSVLDLINLKKSTLIDYLGVGNLRTGESAKNELGTKAVKFNLLDHVEYAADKKYEDLIKSGFSSNDVFTEIHFDSFYSTGEKNLGPELIKHDFSVIAENIVKKNPETAAIIGNSWLLSTPIADRLGFKKVDSDDNKQNDFSTWLQFIDRNGQIDSKRFNKFLETEELPFESVKAYIPVEEFLKKYLPDNLRGKINLKEIDKSKEVEHQELHLEMAKLADKWDALLKDANGFEKFSSNSTLNKIFNLVSAEEKQMYLNFFKTMFEQKINFKDIGKYKNIEIEIVDNNLKEKLKADLYKTKEVVVD